MLHNGSATQNIAHLGHQESVYTELLEGSENGQLCVPLATMLVEFVCNMSVRSPKIRLNPDSFIFEHFSGSYFVKVVRIDNRKILLFFFFFFFFVGII